MSDETKIHLTSIPYGGESGSKRGLGVLDDPNPKSGLRVTVTKGRMNYDVPGRAPMVAEQPVFIEFRGRSAFVGKTGVDALGNPADMYAALAEASGLPVTTREEAKKAIRRLRGFGTDFRFADDEVSEKPAARTAVGAGQ